MTPEELDRRDGQGRVTQPRCSHCHLLPTPEGHDACLGTLPGVWNACCGHGKGEPHVQFMPNIFIRTIRKVFGLFSDRLILPAKRLKGAEAEKWMREHTPILYTLRLLRTVPVAPESESTNV